MVCSIVVLLVVLCAAAAGDEIILKSGERIQGKVERMSDGKMTINSDTMGKVTVNLSDVITFSTSEPIQVHLSDESTFKRPVAASKEGFISVADPEGTVREYAVADIAKINPPPVAWTGSIAASAIITRGNSKNQGVSASLNAARRSEIDRITFDAGYASQRQEDPDTGEENTTQRQVFAGLQYDYFFSKKIYGYANTRAERDAIALIDLRLLAGAGAGYQIVESDSLNANGEAEIGRASCRERV